MNTILKEQYKMVKQSREVLLYYCSTLADKDFIADNSSFGRGSIRNLLVHIVNVYEFWIGEKTLNSSQKFTEYEAIKTAGEAKLLFKSVNAMVEAFLGYFEQGTEKIEFEINGIIMTTDHLGLFTHVITHEFHHKGQILSLSRHLGYVPVDTDIIRV